MANNMTIPMEEDQIVGLNKMSELRGQLIADDEFNYEVGFRKILDLIISDLMDSYPSEMSLVIAHELGAIYCE